MKPIFDLHEGAKRVSTIINPYRFGGGATYTAYSTIFDGSDDWMERDAELTSNADSKVGTVSFWVNFKGGDGAFQYIYTNVGPYVYVLKTNNNLIRVVGSNSGGTTILSMIQDATKVSAIVATTGWVHVLASWNLATPATHLYLNGTEAKSSTLTATNDTLDYTRNDHSIGSAFSGSKLNAELCEVYINSAEYIDFSSSSNRDLFVSGGKPKSLGTDGSTPTGNQPIIYLRSPYNSFTTNSGYGGNFVFKGAGAFTEGTPP